MTTETIWPIAGTTAAKHELLRTYMGAWFAIWGQSPRRRVNYIDGFAGPGVYEGGEAGSPIIVLRTLCEHVAINRFSGTTFNFLLNEADPARFESLKEQVARLRTELGGFPPCVNLNLQNRDFHELGREILADITDTQVLAPTFFFIDPFGFKDVPLALIQQLLRFDACEMLVYFAFENVNRFALAGNVDQHLEALFGTDEYLQAPATGPARHVYLRDLYERQLREVGGFSYVRSLGMVRDTGHTSYYLYFCTRNLQAFDRMKSQMWKLDPSGSYRFEDRIAGVPVLFGDNSTEPLKSALTAQFSGQDVNIQTVVDWVIAETPFYGGQVKRLTLQPMEDAGDLVLTNPRSGRSRGQFPDGSIVRFF